MKYQYRIFHKSRYWKILDITDAFTCQTMCFLQYVVRLHIYGDVISATRTFLLYRTSNVMKNRLDVQQQQPQNIDSITEVLLLENG